MNNHRNFLQSVSFRLATSDDAPELTAMYASFFGEAVYKDYVEFDPVRAEDYLRRVIGAGLLPHITARIDGALVGSVSYSLDHNFSRHPIAVLGELFVVPRHRRSPLGRMLVSHAVELAKGDGATVFHAPVASGMREAKSLFNLLTKGGFEQMGYIMRRGL